MSKAFHNPYLVLGAKGPKLISEEAQFRIQLEKVHQIYAKQIKNPLDSHQLFKRMYEALYRFDQEQNAWVYRSMNETRRYYITMYLYICEYLKNNFGGVPTIITASNLRQFFWTQDQINNVKALYAQEDKKQLKELFLSMWEQPYTQGASSFVLSGRGDLDVWNLLKDYDASVLMDDLQRLKDKMKTDFDHQEMEWWHSGRTIDFYTDTFVRQTYPHGDECLKHLLKHMHEQKRLTKRLTKDTRNVVAMSINFLRLQYLHDRKIEQGLAPFGA